MNDYINAIRGNEINPDTWEDYDCSAGISCKMFKMEDEDDDAPVIDMHKEH